MKKSKYSDAQIMAILKQAESGVPVADLCREHGMSRASFYKWRSKYGGLDASLMARMAPGSKGVDAPPFIPFPFISQESNNLN